MFQPEVKCEFVKRYCPPAEGWLVSVDIDASEEGRTGGERKTDDARKRQTKMQRDGERVRQALRKLGVTVGSRRTWLETHGLAEIQGDRDIIALHVLRKIYLIAEVEGESTGQPEQKLYKAIGQIVMAASTSPTRNWKRHLVIVAYGEHIARNLRPASILAKIGVAGLDLHQARTDDRWHDWSPKPDWAKPYSQRATKK